MSNTITSTVDNASAVVNLLYQAFPSDPTFLKYTELSVVSSIWNSCPATDVKKPKLPFVANVMVLFVASATKVSV